MSLNCKYIHYISNIPLKRYSYLKNLHTAICVSLVWPTTSSERVKILELNK